MWFWNLSLGPSAAESGYLGTTNQIKQLYVNIHVFRHQVTEVSSVAVQIWFIKECKKHFAITVSNGYADYKSGGCFVTIAYRDETQCS